MSFRGQAPCSPPNMCSIDIYTDYVWVQVAENYIPPCVHVLPYLGLLFDSTLSWGEHTTKTITKARKGYEGSGLKSNEVSQKILLILYQMLVLSVTTMDLASMTHK